MIKSSLLILATACCALAQWRFPIGNSVLLGQARYGITPLTYNRAMLGYSPTVLGGITGGGVTGLGTGGLVSPVVSPVTGMLGTGLGTTGLGTLGTGLTGLGTTSLGLGYPSTLYGGGLGGINYGANYPVVG